MALLERAMRRHAGRPAAVVERLRVSAYRVPTDAPESPVEAAPQAP